MSDRKGQRILIVSAEAWGGMRLSKHHYATTLARHGATVFFLGPTVPTTGTITVTRSEHGGPWIIDGATRSRGIRFLPRPIRAWLEARQLRAIAMACGGPFDLLWNFDVYRFRSLMDRRYATTRLLHVMDLPDPDALLEPARNADLTLAVSGSMLSGLEGKGIPTLHVPHGLMLPPNEVPLEQEPEAGGPHIAYLGNLGIRSLDRQALLRIAREQARATLHLIGPWDGAFGDSRGLDADVLDQLRKLPNVRFHGEIPADQIAIQLARMDVLLIAYDTVRFPRETVNSHKVLEYLYSGRVILAPHMADLVDIAHLMVMLAPGRSIADQIGLLLGDLEQLNSRERMWERREYAVSMTYDHHLELIARSLRQLRHQP